MANVYSGILNGTMDAFASIISNNMNIVMKVLAIITIVMSIPTIVFSVLRNRMWLVPVCLIKESIGISDHYPDFCGNQCCGSDHSFQEAIFLIFKSFSERRF